MAPKHGTLRLSLPLIDLSAFTPSPAMIYSVEQWKKLFLIVRTTEREALPESETLEPRGLIGRALET